MPGKPHGWKSLAGYSPWGHKESDTTERLHLTSPSPLQGIFLTQGSNPGLLHCTFFTIWTSREAQSPFLSCKHLKTIMSSELSFPQVAPSFTDFRSHCVVVTGKETPCSPPLWSLGSGQDRMQQELEETQSVSQDGKESDLHLTGQEKLLRSDLYTRVWRLLLLWFRC